MVVARCALNGLGLDGGFIPNGAIGKLDQLDSVWTDTVLVEVLLDPQLVGRTGNAQQQIIPSAVALDCYISRADPGIEQHLVGVGDTVVTLRNGVVTRGLAKQVGIRTAPPI